MIDPSTRGENHFGRALLATCVWPVVLTVVLFATLGPPASPEAGGSVIGQALGVTLLAALGTWLVVRRRARWPLWKLALLALSFFLVVGAAVSGGGAA